MPQLVQTALWRTHPHRTRSYLAAWVPDVVFTCEVNQTGDFTYPVASVQYINGVGSYTNVRVGMTAKVSNSLGVFKAWARIRLAPTAGTIYIGHVSRGEIEFADGDIITVLDDFRLWSRIPKIDASNPLAVTFYKDYDLAYSDQGTKPPPVCNAGPPFADFVDGDGYIYMARDLTANSYAVAQSATISSYSGEIGDGVVTSGSLASGIFTIRFPAGKRICHFTVTDSNGKSHTAHVPVWAATLTGANAPLKVRVAALRGGVEGWSAEFDILIDDASRAAIPEGALVIYWEDESYGSTAGSLNGYTGSKQVKFWGWITDVSVKADPLTSDVTIKAAGPGALLALMPLYSLSLSISSSPVNWYQMANLTLWRLIWYALAWHTTALDVCDLERPSWYASYPYQRFDVPQDTIFGGVDKAAQYVNARLSCDHQGRFYLRRDPQMMTDAERDDVIVTISLDSTDWSNFTIEERNRAPVSWLRASGLLASATEIRPYLSIAPGKTPGQGAGEDALDNQLVTNQTDLNVRCGRAFGVKNTIYPGFSITIPSGGMIADPAWLEWIELTLTANTNRRGIQFSASRFLLREMNITHDHEAGVTEESWSLDAETFGPPGETLPVPDYRLEDWEYVGLPPYRPIEWSIYDPMMAPMSMLAAPAIYGVTQQAIGRTRNAFTVAPPTWEKVLEVEDFITPVGSAQITDWWPEPGNPKNVAYVAIHDNAAVPRGYIFRVQGMDAMPGTQIITKVWDSNDYFGVYGVYQALFVAPSRAFFGGCYLAIDPVFDSCYVYRRGSLQGTWSGSVVGVSGPTNHTLLTVVGCHKPNYATTVVYRTIEYRTGGSTGNVLWQRSTNGGATWSLIASFPVGVGANKYARMIHVPFHNNPNDDLAYVCYGNRGVDNLRRRNADGSLTSLTPQTGGAYYYCPNISPNNTDGRYFFYSSPQDGQALLMLGDADGAGWTHRKYFKSADGGSTWTVINPPGGLSGVDELYCRFVWGWPYDKDYFTTVVTEGSHKGIYWATGLFSAANPTYYDITGDFESVVGSLAAMILPPVAIWVR